MRRRLRAVVFDFDGLLVDTEAATFVAATEVLRTMGHELTLEHWLVSVGIGGDSWPALCAAIGAEPDKTRFDEAMWGSGSSGWHDAVPLLPGARELLGALHEAGVPCAIASSSHRSWIEPHLSRHGIAHHFTTIASADRVAPGRTKPAPDLYELACADLGVDPADAVALEDSAPGTAAAVAAGMTVVVVPSEITSITDLSAAHHSVRSLHDLTPAGLEQLLRDRSNGHTADGKDT